MLKDVLKSKPNVDVVKLQKSGGVVSRNAKVRQKARSYRIRVNISLFGYIYRNFVNHLVICVSMEKILNDYLQISCLFQQILLCFLVIKLNHADIFYSRNIFMALQMIFPHISISQVSVICQSIELVVDHRLHVQPCQLAQSLLPTLHDWFL